MVRRVLAVLATLLGFVLLPLMGSPALAEKRVALVIGNGAYQNVPRLANPIKDAKSMAAMFQRAGFDSVKVRQDLGNLEFKRALREFMDAAQDADIAVVYYAGHGIQVRDMNYMIPVDARLATEIDAEDEAVSLDRMVMALEPAKRLRLVIVDACRDNPFARTMKHRVAVRGVSNGLAKMEPTMGDTLIAYAAKAGSTAEDGGGENSPFATALLKHLPVPGLDVRLAFGRVRDDVLKSTANKQEPFVYGSLGGEAIALVPAPAQPAPQALSDVRGDYELVERIGTRKAWEAFLASHKDGLYADLARAQLAKITQAERPAPTAESPAPSRMTLAAVDPGTRDAKPAEPTTQERRAWDRIKDTNDRDRLRDFIATYPASPLAETAKNRLTTLDRAVHERDEKARAEREAARQREEEAKRAKTEEAERKRLEREAALRREDDAKRSKAELDHRNAEAGAERSKAEQAARARDEQARRDAERAAADRQAAARRPEQNEACARDQHTLIRLRGSLAQAWAREDLKRMDESTTCERTHRDVAALLAMPPAEAARLAAEPVEEETSANTPEQVMAAQSELRRLGCFAGRADGKLGPTTGEAVQRYLSAAGLSQDDLRITDRLVADLKRQGQRLCVAGNKDDGRRDARGRNPQPSAKTQANNPRQGIGF